MVTKEQVYNALENVIDPEIGLNLVELGLIYELNINNDEVDVKMTLTARGCPLHLSIQAAAENVIKMIDGIKGVRVDVVWEPQWTPDRISPEAKLKLGIE